jgi:hypothetical protein
LYYSSTATNVPLAANLAAGELAINTADGKLFYKDSGAVVQVIGWKTTPATAGGTGQTSYAVGDLLYAPTTTTVGKLADVATGSALISGGVGVAPSYGKIGLTTHISGTLALGNGGTGATTAPAAMAALIGFTTTATAAGTTTLTNASSYYQVFTGATTQTIVLPVTSTLAQGWSFHIVNNSTGNLTVNSSGGNLLVTVPPGITAMCTCILTSGTTAASWEAGYTDFSTATGTGSVVLSVSPTITGTSTTIQGLTVGLGNNAVASNTAFGVSALKVAGATSFYSTAIGNGALFSHTTASSNTGVGYSALGTVSTNGDNTGIGAFALALSTGSSNTAVGSSALYSNSTATNNTGVGYGAGYSNQLGSDNTVIGFQANYLNNGGTANTVVGNNAGYNPTSGNNNTLMGQGALFNGGGSNNTMFGYQAGLTATGGTNTLFGYQAGYGITSGAKNVIIGSYQGSAAPISATGSNWIVLSDGDANVRQAIDSAGNAQFGSGAVVVYAPAPATITTTATLTNANLQAQLINTTGTTYTVTLPLGTTLESLISWSSTNLGYDFSVINTASGVVTLAVNTGVTNLGALGIGAGNSARFRIRRTAANTFVIYRIT